MGEREAKREQMRGLVREWRASGEPAAGFARRHGMTKDGFRYWRARFGTGNAVRGTRSKRVAFAPVRVVDDGAAPSVATIEIRLASGDVVRAGHELPVEQLRSVIRLLRERC